MYYNCYRVLQKFLKRSTSPDPMLITPRASASQSGLQKEDSQPIPAPQPQQQVSPLRPLYAPHTYRADGKAVPSEGKTLNEDINKEINKTRLTQKNIISTDEKMIDEPSANNLQQRNVVERPNVKSVGENLFYEEQRKQVMSPLLSRLENNGLRRDDNQAVSGSQAEQPLTELAIKKASTIASSRVIRDKARAEDDELQALQERVNGILNHNLPHDEIH